MYSEEPRTTYMIKVPPLLLLIIPLLHLCEAHETNGTSSTIVVSHSYLRVGHDDDELIRSFAVVLALGAACCLFYFIVNVR